MILFVFLKWRKELQIKLDEEENDRVKELTEKQKQKEADEKKLEEQRKEKLKHKYKGKAYQYRDSSATSLGKSTVESMEKYPVTDKNSTKATLGSFTNASLSTKDSIKPILTAH